MIALELPYPPSANRIWRNINGRTIKSKDYRTWRSNAIAHIVDQTFTKTEPLGKDDPLDLTIMLWPPDRRRRDIDNPVKPIMDALECIIDDDCRVIDLQVSRFQPVKEGRCLVVMSPARSKRNLDFDNFRSSLGIPQKRSSQK